MAASRKISVRTVEVASSANIGVSLVEQTAEVSGAHIIIKRIRCLITTAHSGAAQVALELRQVTSGANMDVRVIFGLTSPASGSIFEIDYLVPGEGLYMTATNVSDRFYIYPAVAVDAGTASVVTISIDFEDAH